MSRTTSAGAAAPVPPAAVGRLVAALRNRLIRLYRSLVPAPAAMLEMIMAAWFSQALNVAARLGIADALAQGPRSAQDLAAALGANPDAMHRLLRVLAAEGVFERRADGRYALNRLGAALRSDSPDSVRDFARFLGGAPHWEHWAHLLDSVKSGKPCVDTLRGMPFFQYLEHDPQLAADFNGAMISVSNAAIAPVLGAYDFSRFSTVADVGGGHGRLLAAILARHGRLSGLLFDLPEVVAGAAPVLAQAGVAQRCRVEPGSFFDGVPAGADAYLLKHIIHDWDDERCLQILGHVRKVVPPGGTLLLVELVLPPDGGRHPGNLLDLEMLASAGGRERTAQEYGALLARAGFRMRRCVPTVGPLSVVEAVPA
ncbi:MAG: hydroxyneurosporene methyltransferase [Nevskia sp.]|nr:hydroxyneurosporene methyltransferase [Nevskia sp.]